ncbi:methyltransferase domain-containing protein [Sulfitobacter aestuarii]|uniref:Methyltransferase domain-containing protein n=1 Tax=Sulfitobacter aestuarii TaxID=2161676 RepID=A0ABW5U481_9RHOB
MGWRLAERLAERLKERDTTRLGLMFLNQSRPRHETHDYICPICRYHGPFEPVVGAEAIRLSAQCPRCHSRERHRFLQLWLEQDASGRELGSFLHFAPEPIMSRALAGRCESYQSADIEPGRADLVLNIEDIDLPDDSLDTVMANHVLEHVDDRKALAELFRVLRPGGRAILTIPVIQSWEQSYEPEGITSAAARHLHFGQQDHVRYFGRDIEDRIRAAGFELEVVTASGADHAMHGLIPGDAIYIATRPLEAALGRRARTAPPLTKARDGSGEHDRASGP